MIVLASIRLPILIHLFICLFACEILSCFWTCSSFWLTFICLFIVMTKRTMKYMTRMGQNTGMLKNSKNVHVMAITTALVAAYLQGKKTTNKFANIAKNVLFSQIPVVFIAAVILLFSIKGCWYLNWQITFQRFSKGQLSFHWKRVGQIKKWTKGVSYQSY